MQSFAQWFIVVVLRLFVDGHFSINKSFDYIKHEEINVMLMESI